MAGLGLHAAQAFSLVVASGGYSGCGVRPSIEVAPLVAEHRLQGMRTSVVTARALSSRGSQALEHRPSSWGARGLSCSTVCGIFLDQGLNPCLLHWQADSLPLSHQGSPVHLSSFFFFNHGGLKLCRHQ